MDRCCLQYGFVPNIYTDDLVEIKSLVPIFPTLRTVPDVVTLISSTDSNQCRPTSMSTLAIILQDGWPTLPRELSMSMPLVPESSLLLATDSMHKYARGSFLCTVELSGLPMQRHRLMRVTSQRANSRCSGRVSRIANCKSTALVEMMPAPRVVKQ